MSKEEEIKTPFHGNLSEGVQATDLNKLFSTEYNTENMEPIERGIIASSQNPLLNFDLDISSQSNLETTSDVNNEISANPNEPIE